MYNDVDYQNHKTEQQKLLAKSIPQLIELDQQGIYKVTICCALAKYLSENKCLREVLDAVANYNWKREKDHPRLHVGGSFDFKDTSIFFRFSTHDSEALIGLVNERHYLQVFKDYKYYSIEAVKHF